MRSLRNRSFPASNRPATPHRRLPYFPLLSMLLLAVTSCGGGGGASGGEERKTCRTQSDCGGNCCEDGYCSGRQTNCSQGSGSNSGQAGCKNTCRFANDRQCDDGGPGSTGSTCSLGSDCADCGPRAGVSAEGPGCTNTCQDRSDRECDDGGPGAMSSRCSLGTDCDDCGPREPASSGGRCAPTIPNPEFSSRCIAQGLLYCGNLSCCPANTPYSDPTGCYATEAMAYGTSGGCQVCERDGGCNDTCQYANDRECDDGGPGAMNSSCPLGSDCADCGPRDITGGGAGMSGGTGGAGAGGMGGNGPNGTTHSCYDTTHDLCSEYHDVADSAQVAMLMADCSSYGRYASGPCPAGAFGACCNSSYYNALLRGHGYYYPDSPAPRPVADLAQERTVPPESVSNAASTSASDPPVAARSLMRCTAIRPRSGKDWRPVHAPSQAPVNIVGLW
jgi:hypothetical protein